MTILQRLLKRHHAAVFDTNPDAGFAFNVKRNQPCSWSIADATLTAESVGQTYTYDLSAFTIGTLASRLATDGFEVSGISAEFAGLSALVLVEGTSTSSSSHSAALQAFRSVLWALMSGFAREIAEVEKQVQEALKQMIITTSSGEWLDLWAGLYGQKRRPEQEDASLATQIPKEAFRIRVNAIGIEQAIYDMTGKTVYIEEPWVRMFRLDNSTLSGSHKFFDGELTGYHLIRPVSTQPIDWADVLPVIHRNKGAGIIVLAPEVRQAFFTNTEIAGNVSMVASSVIGTMAKNEQYTRLDSMLLSVDKPAINYRVAIQNLNSSASNMAAATWTEGTWDERLWSQSYFESMCPVRSSMNTFGSTDANF